MWTLTTTENTASPIFQNNSKQRNSYNNNENAPPHGLRAALMAAIASVSLTIAYGAAPTISGQYAIDWSKVNPDRTSTIQGANIGTIIFSPTISSSSSWYAPSTNSKYTGYTGTDLKYINVVRSETEGTTLGDVYFDMEGKALLDYFAARPHELSTIPMVQDGWSHMSKPPTAVRRISQTR